MASSATVILAHQLTGGQLKNVTVRQCDHILQGAARDVSTRRWEWDSAPPERRAASRTGSDQADAREETRLAVTSLALQPLACGRSDEAARLVGETWPAAESRAAMDAIRKARLAARREP